jgi:hypothetical protein
MTKNGLPLTVPPLLSRPDSQTPHGAATGGVPALQESGGYLYYPHSASSPKTNPSRKKHTNSKYIIRGAVVVHDGIGYNINNPNRAGVYSEIMHKLINELDAAIRLWGRVFALRFDLHHLGITTLTNKWLSRFFKNLRRRLERAYGVSRVGYVWVREQEKSKSQHYHCVLYLDGDIVRHPAKLQNLISEAWQAINPVNHVYWPRHQYYVVDNPDTKNDLVYRISYLAKIRGKTYRKPTVNDFHGSSLAAAKFKGVKK